MMKRFKMTFKTGEFIGSGKIEFFWKSAALVPPDSHQGMAEQAIILENVQNNPEEWRRLNLEDQNNPPNALEK